MKRAAWVFVVLCLCVGPARADEFKQIVKALESQLQARHQGIPWFARAMMHFVPEVRGMNVKIATWENLDTSLRSPEEFERRVSAAVGPEWTRIVRARSKRENEVAYIFAKPEGDNLRLLIASVEKGEAAVVQVRLTPKMMDEFDRDPSQWARPKKTRNPEAPASVSTEQQRSTVASAQYVGYAK